MLTAGQTLLHLSACLIFATIYISEFYDEVFSKYRTISSVVGNTSYVEYVFLNNLSLFAGLHLWQTSHFLPPPPPPAAPWLTNSEKVETPSTTTRKRNSNPRVCEAACSPGFWFFQWQWKIQNLVFGIACMALIGLGVFPSTKDKASERAHEVFASVFFAGGLATVAIRAFNVRARAKQLRKELIRFALGAIFGIGLAAFFTASEVKFQGTNKTTNFLSALCEGLFVLCLYSCALPYVGDLKRNKHHPNSRDVALEQAPVTTKVADV